MRPRYQGWYFNMNLIATVKPGIPNLVCKLQTDKVSRDSDNHNDFFDVTFLACQYIWKNSIGNRSDVPKDKWSGLQFFWPVISFVKAYVWWCGVILNFILCLELEKLGQVCVKPHPSHFQDPNLHKNSIQLLGPAPFYENFTQNYLVQNT